MDDSPSICVAPVDSPPEFTWAERTFIKAIRRIPGMGKTAASERLLTAFRGSAWAMLGYGGSQVLRMASMVILARHLLGPQAFGLVALVNVFISGLTMLSDLGIGTDVVQHRRGDDPAFINTAFLIAGGRGMILWVLASALAYPFAHFYHQPAVFALALVSSVSVLFQSLVSGTYYTRTRHVQLGTITLLRMGAEATGLVVSVLWAMAWPTAWALVIGRVAVEFFFTIGTHLIRGQKVSLLWDHAAAKDIMAFGAGMFASSATYFLAGEAERLVVGKFVDLAVLGCFSLALSITAAATGGPQRLLAQVFYPMIAKSVRADVDLAESQFRKTQVILLALCSCMSIVCIAGGKWIVAILLGPKFVMAGWILQLLGFRAAFSLFIFPTTQLLFALGTSKYAAAGNVAKLAFLAVGLTIAFGKFGFREAIWVLAISPIPNYIPLLIGIRRKFRIAFWPELAAFAAFLGISGLTALIITVG